MKKILVGLLAIAIFANLTAVAQQAAISGTGTTNFIPKWTGASALGNSTLFQSTAGNVGLGTTTPAGKLDVKGTSFLRGAVTLFPTTTTALAVNGTVFSVDNTGHLHFVAGQTFPGTGKGTITGVTAGTGLTGGGSTGSVTLGLNTGFTDGRYAQLGATNTFTVDQDFQGNIFANGGGAFGSTVSSGGDVSAAGNSFSNQSVFNLGFVGTSSTTGQSLVIRNTGGAQALQIENHTNPIGGFTEAQFDVNLNSTFFTDAFGNTTARGTKSAAVALANGNMVKVYSMESPEVWFEDFGATQLGGGITTVQLDPSFAQTVSLAKGYHVFLTPNGDCNGLYVTNKTATSFEVRELNGGRSNVPFDYRIVGHRKGYETTRLAPAKMPTAIGAQAPKAPTAPMKR